MASNIHRGNSKIFNGSHFLHQFENCPAIVRSVVRILLLPLYHLLYRTCMIKMGLLRRLSFGKCRHQRKEGNRDNGADKSIQKRGRSDRSSVGLSSTDRIKRGSPSKKRSPRKSVLPQALVQGDDTSEETLTDNNSVGSSSFPPFLSQPSIHPHRANVHQCRSLTCFACKEESTAMFVSVDKKKNTVLLERLPYRWWDNAARTELLKNKLTSIFAKFEISLPQFHSNKPHSS